MSPEEFRIKGQNLVRGGLDSSYLEAAVCSALDNVPGNFLCIRNAELAQNMTTKLIGDELKVVTFKDDVVAKRCTGVGLSVVGVLDSSAVQLDTVMQ